MISPLANGPMPSGTNTAVTPGEDNRHSDIPTAGARLTAFAQVLSDLRAQEQSGIEGAPEGASDLAAHQVEEKKSGSGDDKSRATDSGQAEERSSFLVDSPKAAPETEPKETPAITSMQSQGTDPTILPKGGIIEPGSSQRHTPNSALISAAEQAATERPRSDPMPELSANPDIIGASHSRLQRREALPNAILPDTASAAPAREVAPKTHQTVNAPIEIVTPKTLVDSSNLTTKTKPEPLDSKHLALQRHLGLVKADKPSNPNDVTIETIQNHALQPKRDVPQGEKASLALGPVRNSINASGKISETVGYDAADMRRRDIADGPEIIHPKPDTARNESRVVPANVMPPTIPDTSKTGTSMTSITGSEPLKTTFDPLAALADSKANFEMSVHSTNSGASGYIQASGATFGPNLLATPLQNGSLSANNTKLIAEAAVSLKDAGNKIDVTLSPEELGRVVVKLDSSNPTMLIVISADRSETLDLIRRNMDLLEQQAFALGHGGASFSFERNPNPEPGQPGEETQSELVMTGSETQTLKIQISQPESGLDIRM